ncbi:MAG: hypothetical protein COV67_07750 [Nitrospinae bacterium CG11_big_fil_rev_8_21_14_0_20_56_8]|nr:MAG: hypothetical protein COV67_07750 [Nitrospinae bacterium CG11_big_fil_rev_8_21_14_0_20_56_8]
MKNSARFMQKFYQAADGIASGKRGDFSMSAEFESLAGFIPRRLRRGSLHRCHSESPLDEESCSKS